jgi:hypothetical protein
VMEGRSVVAQGWESQLFRLMGLFFLVVVVVKITG